MPHSLSRLSGARSSAAKIGLRSTRRRSFARPLLGLFIALGALACDPVSTGCKEGQKNVNGECFSDVAVKLNSVGYVPDRGKRATVAGGSTFAVHDAETKAVVHEGQVPALATSRDTLEELAVIDFSAVTEPGRYYIEVPGQGRSSTFEIQPDIFVEPLQATMLGLYGQRCGAAVRFQWQGGVFTHGVCHHEDARLDHLSGVSEIRPSPYGWHDAGDYGKYTVNGSFAVGTLLKAWEHFRPVLENFTFLPEPGALPDFLAEAKFQIDWVLTMQFEDGAVAHKVSGIGFEDLSVSPEADNQTRFYSAYSTAAAAELVAVTAQAARIYEEFDPDYAATCLAAARKSWEYLKVTPNTPADQGPFQMMQYNTGDADDRLWAAAELFETTGEAEFLEVIETAFSTNAAGSDLRMNWDWPDVGSVALFTYVLSRHGADPATDPRSAETLQAVKDKILANADQLVTNTAMHAYGRGIWDMYYWGINGVVARSSMNLQVAARLTDDEAKRAEYLDAAVQQIDHLLGRNFYARSFVTGVGVDPPRRPHHRPSVVSGRAWPGLLVGGSNADMTQVMENPTARATSWIDDGNDYRTNEVAINWSTAMAYALAGFLK